MSALSDRALVRVSAEDHRVSLFADQSREQLRAVWREAWRKCRARLPLQPLEAQIADVIAAHPEYQALLEAPNEEHGENAYLHLSLHLALREQIATDRPAGIAQVHRHLSAQMSQPHSAEHRMMEVLAGVLAEGQRSGLPPSEQAYLERLRRL